MVLGSQSETVILYNPWAIRMLYALSLLFFTMAVAAALFVALMMAGALDLGSGDTGSLKVAYTIFVLLVGSGGLGIWIVARRYSQTYVKIGPEGVRLRVLKQHGLKWTLLPERSFAWDDVSGIACNKYQRFAAFNAGGESFTLNNFDSPSPPKVAELMAKRKGVPLVHLPGRSAWPI